MPHHAHSIDRWDDATGSNLYEHLAGVNDLLLARATSRANSKPSRVMMLGNGGPAIGRLQIARCRNKVLPFPPDRRKWPLQTGQAAKPGLPPFA